jgi:polysaccharide export outer membrane protein
MTYMRLVALSCLLLLTSCATAPRTFGGAPGLTAVAGNELPPPDGVDALSVDRPYLIGPYDKLVVDVLGIEVDSGGRISFPLAGTIEVGGKTPNAVAADIAARLRTRYIRDPQVTVNLKETIGQVVTVDGQVGKPGLYPVQGKMTLMRAVATAGGTTEFARLRDVVIFRTAQGKQYVGIYNLDAIHRGVYADPEIFANDIVIIGDSPARRMFRDIVQAAPLITTPLIYLITR